MVTIDQLRLRGQNRVEEPPQPTGGGEEQRLRALVRELVQEELARLARLEAR